MTTKTKHSTKTRLKHAGLTLANASYLIGYWTAQTLVFIPNLIIDLLSSESIKRQEAKEAEEQTQSRDAARAKQVLAEFNRAEQLAAEYRITLNKKRAGEASGLARRQTAK